MCIWGSYVYQKGVLCFLIHKSYVRPIESIVLSISMLRLQYTAWCVLIIRTFIFNEFGCFYYYYYYYYHHHHHHHHHHLLYAGYLYSWDKLLLLLLLLLSSSSSPLCRVLIFLRQTIIIIIHLYAGYLQLCAWNNPCIAGYPIQCCSYSVATVCRHALTILMLNALHLYISTLRSSVQCTIWLSSGSSIRTLLRYCLNDYQMVPVALILLVSLLFYIPQRIYYYYPPTQCHHMSFVDFVVLPPQHGRSVTDFWGWDAHEARLRCPDDVSGDMQEDEIPGGALNLNSTNLPRPW